MGTQAPPEGPEGAHPLKKEGPFILLNKRKLINKLKLEWCGPAISLYIFIR
jgi:hypothetical protein